jgi:ABC-type amino acid transport system permease subunit
MGWDFMAMGLSTHSRLFSTLSLPVLSLFVVLQLFRSMTVLYFNHVIIQVLRTLPLLVQVYFLSFISRTKVIVSNIN